jgi:protein-S-isoprenylcysteine O-methyltransferase Ste14
MKNSWRVGITEGQQTELVTTGIYRFSRNPYFASYGLLFVGVLFVYPSIILMITAVSQMIIFHRMILVEEQFLLAAHGDVYLKYKRSVGRYFF